MKRVSAVLLLVLLMGGAAIAREPEVKVSGTSPVVTGAAVPDRVAYRLVFLAFQNRTDAHLRAIGVRKDQTPVAYAAFVAALAHFNAGYEKAKHERESRVGFIDSIRGELIRNVDSLTMRRFDAYVQGSKALMATQDVND
jgi:hypothetical protein